MQRYFFLKDNYKIVSDYIDSGNNKISINAIIPKKNEKLPINIYINGYGSSYGGPLERMLEKINSHPNNSDFKIQLDNAINITYSRYSEDGSRKKNKVARNTINETQFFMDLNSVARYIGTIDNANENRVRLISSSMGIHDAIKLINQPANLHIEKFVALSPVYNLYNQTTIKIKGILKAGELFSKYRRCPITKLATFGLSKLGIIKNIDNNIYLVSKIEIPVKSYGQLLKLNTENHMDKVSDPPETLVVYGTKDIFNQSKTVNTFNKFSIIPKIHSIDADHSLIPVGEKEVPDNVILQINQFLGK